MTRRELTAERLRESLKFDRETGVFTRRMVRGGYKVDDVAGSNNGRGYSIIMVDGRNYPAHRLAWLHVTGEWPIGDLDHINGDTADNRFSNLREATESQNLANARMPANNTSGFKGVSWHKHTRKWVASIGLNGKVKSLGYFATRERAFIEYIFAAWRYFGDFAKIDADYIRAIQKRRVLETVVLWNLARPDYLT
jgi:hypothetical protein